MASAQIGAAVRQMARLFGGEGTVAGLDEAGLLRRFATRRDAAALEALVARHGPMVLGVCRRVLGDSHDAEDAFQATFLVLAKKAALIRDPNLLGPWLHGVAHRVAVRARANAAIRRSRERSGAEEAAMAASIGLGGEDSVVRAELRAALDDEVARLPERFRRVVVLCYLDGLTHDQAAERLRCPVGTVRSRLSAAREKLRGRLVRRGVVVPTAAFAVALSAEAAKASVPLALSESTLSAGMAFLATGAGAASAGMVSSGAASLADGVTTTMFLTKIKILGGLAMAGALTLGVGGAAAMQFGGGSGAKPGAAAAKGASDDTLEALIAKMRKQADVSELEKKELEVALDRARRDADRLRDEMDTLKGQLRDATRAASDDAEKDVSRLQRELAAARANYARVTERGINEKDPSRLRAEQAVGDAIEKLQAARGTLLQAKANAGVAEDHARAAASDERRSVTAPGTPQARDGGEASAAANSGRPQRGGGGGFASGSGAGFGGGGVGGGGGAMIRGGRSGVAAAGMMGGGGGMGMGSAGGAGGAGGGGGAMMGGAGDGMAAMMGGRGDLGTATVGGAGGEGRMGGGGGGMAGMMGGRAGRQRLAMLQNNDYVIVAKPESRKVAAHSTETGEWSTYDVPTGSVVVPHGSAQLVALHVRGEEIKQLATYVPKLGKWFTIDLKVPAKGNAAPAVAYGMAAYGIGPRVYAFSASAARWDTLELPDGAEVRADVTASQVLVEHKDHLYIFSAKTGKWTDFDAGADKAYPEPK